MPGIETPLPSEPRQVADRPAPELRPAPLQAAERLIHLSVQALGLLPTRVHVGDAGLGSHSEIRPGRGPDRARATSRPGWRPCRRVGPASRATLRRSRIRTLALRPPLRLTIGSRPMGESALITGASSGIGRSSRSSSPRGSDLILVARREDRLRELAESLDTTTYTSSPATWSTRHTSSRARSRSSGWTRRSADQSTPGSASGRFLDAPEGRDAEMVRVNCEAVVVLTRAFLRG